MYSTQNNNVELNLSSLKRIPGEWDNKKSIVNNILDYYLYGNLGGIEIILNKLPNRQPTDFEIVLDNLTTNKKVEF